MGPFFLKYPIPLKPKQLTIFNFFRLLIEIPPKAINCLFVSLLKILNLLIPK